MRKILLYSFIAVFISGCSLRTVVPAQTEYQLDLKASTKQVSSMQCRSYVLQVKGVDSYTPIQSRVLYYGIGEYELATYTESIWQEAPFKTINMALIQTLRGSKIFKDVVSSKSTAAPDLLLEYSVDDFMQHFNKDLTYSTANVKIHLSLIDYKSSKILYTTTVEKKLNVDSLDTLGGIKSLSVSLQDVLDQNLVWLDGVCMKGIQ